MSVEPAPRVGVFAALPDEVVAEFRRAGSRRRFPAGTALFLEGDAAHEVLVLVSGAVKVSVGSTDGREVVLDVFESGALLGEMSAIDGGPRSATVTALSSVEVLSVSATAFNDFLDHHSQALRLLLVEVIARLRTRVRHQLEFGAGDALGRVCARLADLAARQGEPDADSIMLRSPVSQSDLASWTGLSRDAVVRALRALRQLGWIDNQGRSILIREPAQVRQRAAH